MAILSKKKWYNAVTPPDSRLHHWLWLMDMLDPLPTWLLKQLKDTLAPVISSLCNCSFQTGVLPAAQKQAIVLPRLKTPTLDSSKLSSFRPISNLSFISKLVERVAANRFIPLYVMQKATHCSQLTSHRTGRTIQRRQLCSVSTTVLCV